MDLTASSNLPMALVVSFCLLVPVALAGVICEDLPCDLCAFAISSSSKRCILESYQQSGKPTKYECRTSEVVVERIKDHIETDQCVKACGVDRNSVGISSDSFFDGELTTKLCSTKCHENCPNIIDLYSNVAAGEGVSLHDFCHARRLNTRRALNELILSSSTAPGPVASDKNNQLDASAAHAPAPMVSF